MAKQTEAVVEEVVKEVVEAPAEAVVVIEPGQSLDMAIAKTFDDALGGELTDPEAVDDEASSSVALSVLSNEPVFERNEISLPRLRLAQGLTQEVQDGTARPGQWVLLGEEPLEKVTVVPLLFGRERAAADASDNTGRTILCRSSDAITGIGTPGGSCARCPLKEFGKDPRTGKNTRPACSLTYRYICWSVDHGSLIELHLKGTATEAARYINTFISTKRLGNFAIELGVKSQSGPRGSYFNPTVKIARIDADEMEMARESVLSA